MTAHILEMLGQLGYDAGHPAVGRALDYILSEQEEDGAWFGRWGVNYVYGTGAVLPALEALGIDMDTAWVRDAVRWVIEHQNEDGGWGESCASYVDPDFRGRGPSTASQTAWALLSLLSAGEADNEATGRGDRPRRRLSPAHPTVRRVMGRAVLHGHRISRLWDRAAAGPLPNS